MRATCLALLLLLSGCVPRSEEVLPVSTSVRSGSRVETVVLQVSPAARAAVAALDERARKQGEGSASLPLADLLSARIAEASRAAGLVTGQPLKLTIELDDLRVAGTGSALIGGADRMAGTVFVRHAETGAALGQLYIDIDKRQAGLLSLALRGGGVREQLAEAFAAEVARRLTGRQHPAR